MKTQLLGEAITIEADKIAEGIVEMFDDSEKTILRFGMLPAAKMECLEKHLREKFASLGHADPNDPDLYYLTKTSGNVLEFSLKDIVSRAMKSITVEIYKIGDLVV